MNVIVTERERSAGGFSPQERLERLGTLGPERMAMALTWLSGYDPRTFDVTLDAVEPCDGGGDPDAGEDAEPYCVTCGEDVGIFLRFGLDWRHYRGGDALTGKFEVFDAGHVPVVAWRPADEIAVR